MNKLLGGGGIDGYYGVNPDWSTISAANNRTLWSITNNRVQAWVTEEENDGNGYLLQSGNYANPKNVKGNVPAENLEDAVSAILIASGLSGNYGFFSSGFDYVSANDVGIDDNLNMWVYNGALPYSVAPETIPSEPDYSIVTFELTTAFKGDWSSLSAGVVIGDVVVHDENQWRALVNIADVTLSEPSYTNNDWQILSFQKWNDDAVATLPLNSYQLLSAIGGDINYALPTFGNGDFTVVNLSPQSDSNMIIAVAGVTIYGRSGSLDDGDNLILQAGDTLHLAADSATILRIV